jgi:elongation factor P
MVETNEFRKGTKILIEGVPFVVVDFQHVKPGKGNQFTRTKLRNMITGSNLERTIKSGEKFEIPDVEVRNMNFLYKDDNGFHFMDQGNYDQIQLQANELGDAVFYLTENLQADIMFFNGRAIGCEVPNAVNLKVARTDPGARGNTVTGATKPATMETGLKIDVPLHINEGDILRIDSRTGAYVERVNK